jgi:hypothetical protein
MFEALHYLLGLLQVLSYRASLFLGPSIFGPSIQVFPKLSLLDLSAFFKLQPVLASRQLGVFGV